MRGASLTLLLVFTACAADGGLPDGATPIDGGSVATCTPGSAVGPLEVATTRGIVRGTKDGDTTAFLGLPYAAPPVGSLRFRAPVEHACWDDVRETKSYGADCLQRDLVSGDARGDEDCLVLNVWTPELSQTANLPVMFWIHGGANVFGSANQRLTSAAANLYDGRALATRERAVVVSINYRLGPLGFLAHAALAADDPNGASGNYAILDQLAALGWVRDNIARFGGDPTHVMVFGESAGAMNSCVLLASPRAKGLFSSVLMQSGDCSAQPRAKAEAKGAELAAKLGCSDAACLRQASAEAITVASAPFTTLSPSPDSDLRHGLANTLEWSASIDGWVVPSDPMAALLAGEHNKLPLVVGSNADEMALFLIASQTFTCGRYESDMNALFGSDAAQLIAAYPCVLDGRAAEVAALTDLAMTCPARRIARASAAAGAPTFRYYFDHAATYGPTVLLGAYHAAELPYVFDSFAAEGYIPTKPEEQLSEAIRDHWGRHAATGSPNGVGLEIWPAHNAADERWLELDLSIDAKADAKGAECDLWAQIMGW